MPEIAVSENKADPIHFAYLTDRIAVFEGKPKLHGIQFTWDKAGKLSTNLYDDLAKVNQRRASIGLNTLENQTTIMRNRVMKKNQPSPKDFQKRHIFALFLALPKHFLIPFYYDPRL